MKKEKWIKPTMALLISAGIWFYDLAFGGTLKLTVTDVTDALNACKVPLIIAGVLTIIAVILALISFKLKKPLKNLVRVQSPVALLLAVMVAINGFCNIEYSVVNSVFSGSVGMSEETYDASKKLALQIAEEGIVLLKNEEKALPLSSDISKINVFGWSSIHPIYGGTGSGAMSEEQCISLIQGLENAGYEVNSKLQDFYHDFRDERPHGSLLLREIGQTKGDWTVPEPTIEEYEEAGIFEQAKEFSDTAMIFIARSGGEAGDLPMNITASGEENRQFGKLAESYDFTVQEDDIDPQKSYLELSNREEKMVDKVAKEFENVIVVINSSNTMELGWLEKYDNIKAALVVSGPGEVGFQALGKILKGDVNPSGHLTDTYVYDLYNTPVSKNYGSFMYDNYAKVTGGEKNISMFVNYVEGIYVGYKFYETAAKEGLINYEKTVQYPFGYGLSYTEFDIRLCGINTASKGVTVTVEVENTGTTYSGKEVVQIYASLPQDGSRKEFRRLVGYEKTEELKPGEKEMLNIVLPAKAFASFLEEQQEWRIQAGAYGIWIGNSLSEAKLSAGVKVSADVMMEKTKKLEDHSEVVEIKDCAEELCRRAEEWTALLEELPNVSFEPEAEEKKVCRFPEETEIPVEDLISLLYGNMSEIRSTLGASGIKVPGTAGETSEALLDQYGIPSLIMADGPAGIRLQQTYEVDREKDTVYGTGVLGSLENGYLVGRKDHEGAERYYQYCTAFPVGTALAQSWNKKLMEQFGRKVAAEMEEFHINLWLAPGLNIHRNPLCGRNFEYYSEDPFLAGTLAAAVTRGVQSRPGCGVTIKHFACNNQEDNRMGVDAHVSERTLREIYLRGFEIAVKEGAPTAIMSSYNLINGVHAANSKDLCTRIAREEWGFDGVIMSDWNTTVPEDGSIPWVCVAAGNDIIMPGNPDDDKNIRDAYKEGKLTEKEIRLCADRILKLIRRLS